MPLEVDWGDFEETLLIWKFTRRWTEEEFYEAIEKTRNVLMNSPHKISMILDIRYSNVSPPQLMSLVRKGIRNSVQEETALKVKHIIILSYSEFWSRIFMFVFNTVRPDLPYSLHFEKSIDTAYSIVEAKL